MDTSSPLRPPAVAFKGKFSPKKLHPGLSSKPQLELVVDNNDEDEREKRMTTLPRRTSDVRLEKKQQLAAALLQHQVQLWLLRRQETLQAHEVAKLRGELRKAAVRVLEESYGRYVKRRAIRKYLHEFENLETKVDKLLQFCVIRKRQMEEVQRFASLRRQQKRLEEDRKRKLVHDWLSLCIQTRRKEQEQKATRAHEILIGWVRRWTLRKRCEARAAGRERERQEEEHRRNNVQRIVTLYRAYKLCRRAKEVVQRQRCMRDGMMKLYGTFRLSVLRTTQSHWLEWIQEQKRAHEAAATVQRVYRGHQTRTRYAKTVASCQQLQRVCRGHQARVFCKELKRLQHQNARERNRNAAATVIQRLARGYLTRLWFRDVLLKLRERFRCVNCGAVEPGGSYCKYCGRRRPSFVTLSNVLMFHEKWQQRKSLSMMPKASRDELEVLAKEVPGILVPVVPPPKKPTLRCSRSSSLRLQASSSSSLDLLTALPAVLSSRHGRLVARNSAIHSIPNIRRNSIASISEQTALRAMAIADLQVKFTAATHANVLEMHLSRQQKANKAINR
ncbi:hypothetical protein V7S43_005704 [Phytophthora oleae]|uniref:Sfi1 spindle body domain-containing protein n=1 Tax=Phytophthora oleae TaxID=2107226 RepID=A0ABD3FSI5_9STRA